MKQISYSPPILILGVPLSGGNLLRAILDTHSQIAGAREADWLAEGYTHFSINDLAREAINGEFGPASILPDLTPDVAKDAARVFLFSVFCQYLANRKKKYLVLETPDDTAHLESVLDLFPDSKCIHIFRDGRDVACSAHDDNNAYKGEALNGAGENTLFDTLRKWHDWEQKIRLLLRDRDSISISFEQFVHEPSKIVQQVLSFLDLPFEEEMIPIQESEANSMLGPQSESGRWKTEILPENWDPIDVLYGTFFEELGYKRCNEVKKENAQFSQSISPKNYELFAALCEKEILALRKVNNENSLHFVTQLRSKQQENDRRAEIIAQLQKDIKEKNEQISELNHKINAIIPSLEAQLYQKSQTILGLQSTLKNENELLTRIITGKSFKLGRLLTAPTRHFRNKPSDENTLKQILQRKKRFVNLGDQLKAGFGNHRSGWAYALASLAPINRPDSIYLDTFIERTFVWKPGEIVPTLKPWIGFIHVPPNVPDWFQSEQSNDVIFQTKAWQESFPYCRGLFTLSNYHKRSLERKLNIPINALLHPTEFPGNTWQFEKFVLNPARKIVQIGWWLRKLHAIFELPPSDYEKVFLRISSDAYFHKIFHQEYLLRKQSGSFQSSMYDSVRIIEFLENVEYDRLLSENIVFADLYDSSANNLVIECIARNTPLLINPLEPVVEYLGKDYPFYFTSYEEAIEKAQNLDLVEETHNYLKNHEIKLKLTGEYFLQSFTNSEILNNCVQ